MAQLVPVLVLPLVTVANIKFGTKSIPSYPHNPTAERFSRPPCRPSCIDAPFIWPQNEHYIACLTG